MKDERPDEITMLKGVRILLAEDSDMNRLVTTTTLNNYGATVYEVINGLQAIEAVKNNPFDLVLMDVQMPVMDGRKATEMIRSVHHLKIPIIALTSNVVKMEMDKCFASGMNDYLAKTFEEDELIQLIGKWLSKDLSVVHQVIGNENSLYSLGKLNHTGRGNPGFVDRMIQLFILQVPAGVQEIKLAYAAGNFFGVEATAHRLEPILNNFCIGALKEEIGEIQSLSAENKAAPRLEYLIRKLDTISAYISEDLKN